MHSVKWWHCGWPWVTPNCPKPPYFLHFAPTFIASLRVNLETSNLVHLFSIASPILPMKNLLWKGHGQGFTPHVTYPQQLTLETSYFVDRSGMWSLSLMMSECSLSGHGQGHVSNFYIVDLENFATASCQYTGDIHNSVRNWFVYDTYKTMEATRSHRGWVHMFITHWPTVTLQLHNFDLFRTCRTSSFCTVAWQLAGFQLTRRIAQSLGNSWTSCTKK